MSTHNLCLGVKVRKKVTGHLRYLEIKGNGETTSSFLKFEISKLRPAEVLRKSQLFMHQSFATTAPSGPGNSGDIDFSICKAQV